MVHLITQRRVDIRTVNGGMTTGTPARAAAQERGMRNVANENIATSGMDLRVAFETKIVVPLHEHLVIDRTVRAVTNRASLPQRFVLVNHHFRLLAMALRAAFILPGKRQAACRFENVRAMRVMALDTIHLPFENRMMLRQFKFGVGIDMALETSVRILAWVHNENTSATSCLDVFAARTVTGLAS